MGNIPIQQSPGARQSNYGSLPGRGTASGRPDVASGKVNRRIYGQHERFIARQSGAPSPGAIEQAYGQAGAAMSNLGQKIIRAKEQHEAEVQRAVDYGATSQAGVNSTAFYSDISGRLKQAKDLDSFDSIMAEAANANDAIWSNIDQNDVSEDALMRIQTDSATAGAKFEIKANQMRNQLRINNSMQSLKNVVDQSIIEGTKDKGLDAIKGMRDIGGVSREEAEGMEQEYLNKFAYHEAYTVARNNPRQILDDEAIYDKDKYPRLTGNQRDNIRGIAQSQQNRMTEGRWVMDKDKATNGFLSDDEIDNLKGVYTPSRVASLKVINDNAIQRIDQDRKKAEADNIKKQAAKDQTARSLQKTVIDINDKRMKEHTKMLDAGTNSVQEIRTDNHLRESDKKSLLKRLGYQKQMFYRTPEWTMAKELINNIGKDAASRNAASDAIMDLRVENKAPDSVIIELVEQFQANIDMSEQKDDGWFADTSRRKLDIQALNYLDEMYRPILQSGTAPAEVFGLYRSVQEDLFEYMDEAPRTQEELQSKVLELTKTDRKAYMLDSVKGAWMSKVKPNREEGLEELYLELEPVLSEEEMNQFRGFVRQGAPIDQLMDLVSKNLKGAGAKNDIGSIIEQNMDKDFVRRILNTASGPSPIKNKDGSSSTHLMSYAEVDGRYIVYPSIVNIDGKLKKLGDREAVDYALKNNEFIEFNSAAEAENFSINYKKFLK
jgi:hypothetical protein